MIRLLVLYGHPTDPAAFDRDRSPRDGDKAVHRGRVVLVADLGLPDDDVRRMCSGTAS